jgi:hypothetical protein
VLMTFSLFLCEELSSRYYSALPQFRGVQVAARPSTLAKIAIGYHAGVKPSAESVWLNPLCSGIIAFQCL